MSNHPWPLRLFAMPERDTIDTVLARVRSERSFSGRKAFLDRVQQLVWQKTEMRVAWPDVLWFVTADLLEQARQDTVHGAITEYTREQIVAMLAAEGVTVTDRQIRYWAACGRIAKPERRKALDGLVRAMYAPSVVAAIRDEARRLSKESEVAD